MSSEVQPNSGIAPDGFQQTLPAQAEALPTELLTASQLIPEIPLWDNGKPIVIELTPERARAGKEAIDALFLLPNIRPDTPLVDAVAVLNQQIPLIYDRASQQEQALAQARRRKRSLIARSTTLVAVATLGWGCLSGYNAYFSPEAHQRYIISRSLGLEPSATSLGNWAVRYPAYDPNIRYEEIDSQKKPKVLTLGSTNETTTQSIIVDNSDTRIFIKDEKLPDGRIIPNLRIGTGGSSSWQDIYLHPDLAQGADTTVLEFENLREGDRTYVSLRRKGTNPPTYEVREMKKVPQASTSTR